MGKNPDTCKPFTITECKTVLLNQTITRNVEIEKNITIQYCESVPKTKCEIAQVDKTHCTTEVVEVCITLYILREILMKILRPLKSVSLY